MTDIKDLIENNEIFVMLKPFFMGEEVYLVGGFLRDCVLGKISSDLDFVTKKGHARGLSQKIADNIKGYFVPLDEENHIYRVVFPDKIHYVDFADYAGNGIEDDLKRRDFTINAMAYDVNKGNLIDITGSLKDLKENLIKEISEENILEDPVRILRAFRFQSELGFSLSDNLKKIISTHAHDLQKTAKERINAELIKLFGGENADEVLYSLDENNILEMIVPEIREMKKVPKNSHHHLNLFEHSIETVRQIQCFYNQSCEEVKRHLKSEFLGGQKRICYLKLAAFLHDVGKPVTWQIEPVSGRHRFIRHDAEGAKIIAPTLKELKFSKKQIAYIQKLIKNHIYPASVVTSDDAGDKAYMRFYRKIEDETIDLIAIAYADRMSALGPDITQEMIDKNINGLNLLLEGYLKEKNKLAPLPKLLDGEEIMKILGIDASPELGRVIKALKEAQMSSLVTTRDEAADFIKKLKL